MALKATDLTAGYVPGVNILNGLSLHVNDGEIVSVIGPNGSGKSTFLKCLIGVVPVRSGRVELDGEDVTDVPTHRRVSDHATAFVPQLQNVFAPLTIRDNLRAGGHKMPRREREERIAQLLDENPSIGRSPGSHADSLSGGERQVLAVCRAMMPRPRLLMLDEPSAGLSPLKAAEFFDMISGIRAREGVTVLMVEQNATQSLSISDRAVVLIQGRVAMADTAANMLSNPQVSELYLGGMPSNLVVESIVLEGTE
jgi:branched-chain amino acid transport system ATP-binding protein